MIRTRKHSPFLGLAVALCALALPGAVRAQNITVSPTVTSLGNGLYHYDYSIANGSALDLSLVTISAFGRADAVQNLTVPTGFTAVPFDYTLGLLDFAGDTQNFVAGTTVSGFAFDSAYAPGASTFEALALPDNSGIVTFDGTTLAPAAPVPEASTATSLGLALVPGLIVLGLRRRRSKALDANKRG